MYKFLASAFMVLLFTIFKLVLVFKVITIHVVFKWLEKVLCVQCGVFILVSLVSLTSVLVLFLML